MPPNLSAAVALDAVLGDEQPHGTARSGNWMHVEFHGLTSRLFAVSCLPQFTTANARVKLKRLYPSLTQPGARPVPPFNPVLSDFFPSQHSATAVMG